MQTVDVLVCFLLIFNQNVGVTPLWLACQNGHNHVVQSLINYGAKVDEGKKVRMSRHQLRFLAVPTSNRDVCVQDTGSTPLFMACQNGHADIVKTLLDSGAVVSKGRTVRASLSVVGQLVSDLQRCCGHSGSLQCV